MKRKKDVKETDFEKEAKDQPIVVPGSVVGGVIGLLGVMAGPLAFITIPIGVAIGLIIAAGMRIFGVGMSDP